MGVARNDDVSQSESCIDLVEKMAAIGKVVMVGGLLN